jgi:hypothetical protein
MFHDVSWSYYLYSYSIIYSYSYIYRHRYFFWGNWITVCSNNTTKYTCKSMKGNRMQLHTVDVFFSPRVSVDRKCSHSLGPGAEIFAGGFSEEAADRTTVSYLI